MKERLVMLVQENKLLKAEIDNKFHKGQFEIECKLEDELRDKKALESAN
jgi:hypothetical protein